MGSNRPTLDTVAGAAGVSRMTVSNAYNRPDQLSAATRERVLAVAATLGYPGPDPAARSLRRGRAGTVGVLMTERLPYAFTDPGMVSLMRGLAAELGTAGQSMLLVPSESDDVVSVVRGAVVDAFIICSMGEHDDAVGAVQQRRLPLVTVGHPRLKGVPFFGIDNAAAGGLVAEHLLGLGHRRLGVVGLPGRDSGDTTARLVPVRIGIRQRVTGFSRAAAAVPDAHVRVIDTSENTLEEGTQAALALLDRPTGSRPTAVFAVTDVLALAVLEAAHHLGLAVPEQLSVVGFDDIAEAARSRPPLTTVAQDLESKGRLAARAALDLVAGRPVRSPRLSARLVVRQSTGAAGVQTS
ncbi:MAG TPA: LacI family DNA-binding transcriptional regulator [Dermatophilaceae bacterium]|nr:LacI family DNA-binding transcriptional regulator [Dermatophilaceae bacterium]